MLKPSVFEFHPVMEYTGPLTAIDLSKGYDHSENAPELRGAGGYLERREAMYTSGLYGGKRFIHMGVDIWVPEGAPVFAFDDGVIWGVRDNNNELDYGPTLVTEHEFGGMRLFALHGHLSKETIIKLKPGTRFSKGDVLGVLGSRQENGGWIPHLHFQISVKEPDAPDMPGVVSEEELQEAIKIYPDPRIVLGPLYL